MAFHFFTLLFSLNLIVMTCHAAVPPQVYWERMLPNTPMPKAIIDLLNLGSKETNSPDEFRYTNIAKRIFQLDELPFYGYVAKKIQSQDELPFYGYGAKKIQSLDELPFYGYGVKKIQSQDELPFIRYGAKKIQSQDELPFIRYGAKKIQSQDELPFYGYGVKKIQSQDELPFIRYGAKKIQSQDELPFYGYGVKKIQSQDELPFYGYGAKKIQSQDELPFIRYGAKKIQSQDALPKMTPNIANHQQDTSKADLIFLEEGLRPGTKLDAHFNKRKYENPLLPRQVSQSIPFSSEKIKEIFEILSVKQKSEDAEIVKVAINYCEAPVMNGEERHCATSLESMVDFITSKLGKNVHVISTESEKETKSEKFLVKDGVKMLAEDKVIACHPMKYPYVVFFCHEILNTTAHFMPLEGEDGTRVKGVAVCHRDTSEWDPDHVAFQVLKMKPGTAPVCHLFPEGHLLWFAK